MIVVTTDEEKGTSDVETTFVEGDDNKEMHRQLNIMLKRLTDRLAWRKDYNNEEQ